MMGEGLHPSPDDDRLISPMGQCPPAAADDPASATARAADRLMPRDTRKLLSPSISGVFSPSARVWRIEVACGDGALTPMIVDLAATPSATASWHDGHCHGVMSLHDHIRIS